MSNIYNFIELSNLQDHLAHKEQQDHVARLDHLGLVELQEALDLKVPEVNWDHQELLDSRDREV